MMYELNHEDALIVVDVQNDFCPGGALAVKDGDAVVPVLNKWLAAARGAGAAIVASRDWHPPGHCSFAQQGGPWPEHCVRETEGAAFHPDLELPPEALIISKGRNVEKDNYSAFDGTGLGEQLRKRDIRRLWIGGLAQDVCVKATVIDACDEGFDTHLIAEATRPVNVDPGDGDAAIAAMRDAGARIATSQW